MNKILFSNSKDDWETPQDLFNELHNEFNFSVDMAANEYNAKCKLWINNIDLVVFGDNISSFNNKYWYWCNPPYSSQRKFIEFSIKHSIKTVFLLPSRTDTKMFHELIYNKTDFEIRFIKGRLKFSNSKNSAPFPSMIVIYRRNIE